MSTAFTPCSMKGSSLSALAACGSAEENEVNAFGNLGGYFHVAGREVREHLSESPARCASTGDGGYLNFGVAMQNARQLHSGVSGYVDNSYLHR